MKDREFDKKVWEAAAIKYGLDIQFNFTLSAGEKEETFEVLLKGFGVPKGMIIDRNYEKISKLKNFIMEHGFGFSCMELDSA